MDAGDPGERAGLRDRHELRWSNPAREAFEAGVVIFSRSHRWFLTDLGVKQPGVDSSPTSHIV